MIGATWPNVWIADLSRWNGAPNEPDFEAAIGAGLIATMQKLTQGLDYHDPSAALNLYNFYSAEHGMPAFEGGYHFGTNQDPTAQARTLYDAACQRWPSAGPGLRGVQLALDLEGNGGSTMTVQQAEAFIAAFRGFAGGKSPMIYMGKFGPDGRGTGLPSGALASCDLWLPKYDGSTLQAASLPAGFTMLATRLWQFTNGTHNGGPVAGLGAVDQSKPIGFSTFDAFKAWWLS